ncbi:MAG: DUF5947 family protein, partial [Jatrophihabitantaceae bacterium]
MTGPGPEPVASTGAISLLQRIAASRPARPDHQRCEMCGEPIADEHGHVVNLASRNLMCTCRPCTLLFAYDQAQLRYRAVPRDYRRMAGLGLPASLWSELQIPVGLAFLFYNSSLQRTVAFYPGPAGATESELPVSSWQQVLASHPALATVRDDVEAVLLRADGAGPTSEPDRIDCYL